MSTQKLVENIAAGNLVESKENFVSTLAEKIQFKIAEAKQKVSKKMCKDDDCDDESGESDEEESGEKEEC